MADSSTALGATPTVSPVTVTANTTPQAVGPQQASWRGIAFGVKQDSGQFGRRQAVHQYPKRNKPYPEDMGRKARRFGIDGFLLSNGALGAPIASQLAVLIAAAEVGSAGTLVHPILGTLTCVVDDFDYRRGLDGLTYAEFSFKFIESGNAKFPGASQNTQQGSLTAAIAANVAAITSFVSAITPLLPFGDQALVAIVAATGLWTGQITYLAADATSLVNLASALPGNFGRYANGANLGLSGLLSSNVTAGTTVADLIAVQTMDRAAVAAAVAAETGVAANLGLAGNTPADFGAAVQASLSALSAVPANPADLVRILSGLAVFSSGATDAVSPLIDTLHQRAVVVALAQATATYQPSSYNDAAALRANVGALLDVQILAAGDAGDDVSWAALVALKAAVVADLTARGALLPAMATFNLSAQLPALVVAQRLYRDSSRADQLVGAVDPPNPLFMPRQFQALAA